MVRSLKRQMDYGGPERRRKWVWLSRSRNLRCLPGVMSLFFILLLLHGAAFAADAKLQPVDEAPKDPSFLEFRNTLIQAVRKRNLKFVLSVLDPEIKNSFGGDGGVEEFKRIWEPDKPGSRLWDTLLKLLSLGGSYSGATPASYFSAPYVYSRWPDDFDPFDYAAVTGTNVRLRREAGASATVIASLSYDIVKLEEYLPGIGEPGGQESTSWIKVTTPDGTTGYVSRDFIYSPVDHRVTFEKQSGQWRIKYFIAGD